MNALRAPPLSVSRIITPALDDGRRSRGSWTSRGCRRRRLLAGRPSEELVRRSPHIHATAVERPRSRRNARAADDASTIPTSAVDQPVGNPDCAPTRPALTASAHTITAADRAPPCKSFFNKIVSRLFTSRVLDSTRITSVLAERTCTLSKSNSIVCPVAGRLPRQECCQHSWRWKWVVFIGPYSS